MFCRDLHLILLCSGILYYKKILSLSHKVCRLLSSAVLADERKKRASREKANERKTEGKERGEPVSTFFKYLNPPTITRGSPEKTVSRVKTSKGVV